VRHFYERESAIRYGVPFEGEVFVQGIKK